MKETLNLKNLEKKYRLVYYQDEMKTKIQLQFHPFYFQAFKQKNRFIVSFSSNPRRPNRPHIPFCKRQCQLKDDQMTGLRKSLSAEDKYENKY